MIKPLPVKKNKFGQRVDELTIYNYYGQIFEEVLEAHKASVIFDVKKHIVNEGCGQCIEYIDYDNEPEEIVDLITCCVTRLDIIGGNYDNRTTCRLDYYKDFYTQLSIRLLETFNQVVHIPEFEKFGLSKIIYCCVKHLEHLGYDESAREKLYAAVNEKNKKRGYFEV